MKYVDYKTELQKPENSQIVDQVVADFRQYLEYDSNLPHMTEVGFDKRNFFFEAGHLGEVADSELYSVWHCWLSSNGFKYLNLQHQPMHRGFAIFTNYDGGTFWSRECEMHRLPIPELTLINDYAYMQKLIKKAEATHPELTWEILDIRVEWRKA